GASGTGGAVNFASSTIDALGGSNLGLSILAGSGAVTLGPGGSTAALGALSVITSGALTLNGNITTDPTTRTGDNTHNGAFLRGADVPISPDATGDGPSGVVNLSVPTIAATAPGQQGLTIVSGDGDGTDAVVLGQAGSLGKPLKSLLIQRTSATGRTVLG